MVRRCQSRRKTGHCIRLVICWPNWSEGRYKGIILLTEVEEVDSVKLIPVELLFEEEGMIAADILSSSSSLLLPAGLHLQTLRKTCPGAVELLQKHGIKAVPVKNAVFFSIDEFRNILRRVQPPVSLLNPLIVQVAAHQMEVVYSHIRNKSVREKGIRSLLSLGNTLCSQMKKTPQITLSLGESNGKKTTPFLHAINVSLLAGHISGRLFPMWMEFNQSVTLAGLLHDIGKSFLVPFTREQGKRPLSADSKAIQTHPLLGEALLRDTGVTSVDILSAVRSHHESWDGSGYPDALRGESISVGARIIAVADFFENLLNARDSDERKRSDQAVSTLLASANGRFDKFIVRTLLSTVGLFPPGAVVELSDGRKGVVLESKERDLVRPRVLLMTGDQGEKDAIPEVLDLKTTGNIYIRQVFEDYGKMIVQPLKRDERPSVLFRKFRAPSSIG